MIRLLSALAWLAVSALLNAADLNAADDNKNFHAVDLQPNANQKRSESLGSGVEGNHLARLPGGEQGTERGKIVWTGESDRASLLGCKIRLYLTSWENPKPNKKVASIDYLGKKGDTVAAPSCVAIAREA